MSEPQLGRMQFRIMQILWDRGRVTAREITDALNESEPGSVAHSTVQTLLRQLEAKGAAGHEADGRTFRFFAQLKEDRVKKTATRDLLERVFGGSAGSLVAHLINHERLSKKELDELQCLIDQMRKE
jgi:BlaI family penicillinase repressor